MIAAASLATAIPRFAARATTTVVTFSRARPGRFARGIAPSCHQWAGTATSLRDGELAGGLELRRRLLSMLRRDQEIEDRHHEEGEDRPDRHPADQDHADAVPSLRARTGHEHQR